MWPACRLHSCAFARSFIFVHFCVQLFSKWSRYSQGGIFHLSSKIGWEFLSVVSSLTTLFVLRFFAYICQYKREPTPGKLRHWRGLGGDITAEYTDMLA
jgi:hypothetical protein